MGMLGAPSPVAETFGLGSWKENILSIVRLQVTNVLYLDAKCVGFCESTIVVLNAKLVEYTYASPVCSIWTSLSFNKHKKMKSQKHPRSHKSIRNRGIHLPTNGT